LFLVFLYEALSTSQVQQDDYVSERMCDETAMAYFRAL